MNIPTVQNIVNRIAQNELFLKKHPEYTERLNKRIEKDKLLIIESILNANGNPALKQIEVPNGTVVIG